MIHEASFLTKMLEQLQDELLDKAYDKFAFSFSYDLRKTKNGDHLIPDGWEIDEETVTFKYHEVTPHDCPYGVELVYNITNLKLNIQAKSL